MTARGRASSGTASSTVRYPPKLPVITGRGAGAIGTVCAERLGEHRRPKATDAWDAPRRSIREIDPPGSGRETARADRWLVSEALDGSGALADVPPAVIPAGSLLGGALFHVLPAACAATANATGVWGWTAAGFSSFFAPEQGLHGHHSHRNAASCKKPLGVLLG